MSKTIFATAASSLLLSLSLAGCASYSGCPPLVTYTPDTRAKAADEFHALPAESALRVLVTDYAKTRAACRIGGATVGGAAIESGATVVGAAILIHGGFW